MFFPNICSCRTLFITFSTVSSCYTCPLQPSEAAALLSLSFHLTATAAAPSLHPSATAAARGFLPFQLKAPTSSFSRLISVIFRSSGCFFILIFFSWQPQLFHAGDHLSLPFQPTVPAASCSLQPSGAPPRSSSGFYLPARHALIMGE